MRVRLGSKLFLTISVFLQSCYKQFPLYLNNPLRPFSDRKSDFFSWCRFMASDLAAICQVNASKMGKVECTDAIIIATSTFLLHTFTLHFFLAKPKFQSKVRT